MSEPKRMSDEEFEVACGRDPTNGAHSWKMSVDTKALIEEGCRARETELRAYNTMKLALLHVGLQMPPAPEGVRAISEMKAFVADFERSRPAEERMAAAEQKMEAANRDLKRLAGFCPEHRLDQPHKDCPACNPNAAR